MTARQVAAGTSVLAGTAVLAYFGMYIFKKIYRNIIPWKWEEIGTLTDLYYYPLKSSHYKELEEADVTEVGIRARGDEHILMLRDRSLVIYGAKDHEIKTARTYPKILQIEADGHSGNCFTLSAPSMKKIKVRVPNERENMKKKLSLFKVETVDTLDCGDEIAEWLSRYIFNESTGVRLGYNDFSSRRDTKAVKKEVLKFYKNYTSDSTGLYSDEMSMNLINSASVRNLQAKIPDTPISHKNFRPNLVVDSPNIKAFDEDNWEWIKIGDVVLRTVKDCTRCMMTTLNPGDGARNQNSEPLSTLKKFRLRDGPEKDPSMGIQLEVRRTGLIKRGEKVFICRRK